jgi:hypothetical protein
MMILRALLLMMAARQWKRHHDGPHHETCSHSKLKIYGGLQPLNGCLGGSAAADVAAEAVAYPRCLVIDELQMLLTQREGRPPSEAAGLLMTQQIYAVGLLMSTVNK